MESVVQIRAQSIESPAARYPGFGPVDQVLRSGWRGTPDSLPLPVDIRMRRDVAIALRDGTTIYADVFSPATDGARPTLVGWGPYGKRGGVMMLDDLPMRGGVPLEWQSGLEMFEGPDPAYWCAHGYNIVNIDARGVGSSQGDIRFWGRAEGRDGHDAIEWIAAQSWSDGKVAMSGTSWLAIVQWFVAAERPPHLSAILPCEGWTDLYRCDVVRGGVPDIGFNERMTSKLAGGGMVESIPDMVRADPLMNDYWRDKIPDVESIDIPAYVVASWTNLIHASGALAGFERLGGKDKWLRIHNSHEWRDYYTRVEDQRRFFDHVLKGADNGWDQTPRVRLAVLDPGGMDEVDRAEADFPLPRTRYVPFFVNPQSGTLDTACPAAASSIVYDSEAAGEAVAFRHVFDTPTEVVGHLSLVLWVEPLDADDTDLYVEVRKVLANGQRAACVNFPAPRAEDTARLEREYLEGKASFGMMFFSGAKGILRASHRATCPQRSLPARPYHLHESEEKLSPGDIVRVEVPIWPLGMRWRAGEGVEVLVSGRKLSTVEMPGLTGAYTVNKGRVRIHGGGEYPSCLMLPVTN